MASTRVQKFLPSINGVQFGNSWPNIPDYTLSLLGQNISIGNASNGLCGGMVFAVADLFNAGLLPPRTGPVNPAGGTSAFNYIVARLTNSFDYDDVNQYLSWIQMSDHDTLIAHGLAWHEINEEWPKIKADLDRNLLSPLGLVHGQEPPTIGVLTGLQDLGMCHQVLAWGYDLNGTNLSIFIYDPDNPGVDNATIALDIGNPAHTTPIAVSNWPSGTYRGFFHTHYQFHDPSTPASGSYIVEVVSSPGFPNGGSIPSFPTSTANQIAVQQNQDGRVEVFYLGYDATIYHDWQTAPNSGWTALTPDLAALGGRAKQITAAQNLGRRLEVFYVGTNNDIYHNWQTAPNSLWAGEAALGGAALQITVGQNQDGRLEVFYVGTDNNIYHNWQTAPNSGWAGEAALGGAALQITVGQNQDGRLEVFYVGTDNNIYHNWQTAPNSLWAGEAALGGAALQITVGQNQDGRLEVFYVGTDNNIYHNWQTAPNSAAWAGEAALGGAALQITVGQNQDGRLEVFYVGTDKNLYHNWQTAPNSGWAGQAALGGAALQIAVGQNQDGRLEVFYVGTDKNLYHNWQTAPNSGWAGQANLAVGILL
ncbi:hypothetical protein H7849_18030 [Alloacidobacterium dinghuense]|uniref:PLL-like beta propeller domain-containing protein n=1 Tax=Alloacidobacterium dinghuense TaxID=2763107 RepID=A0A7G8BEM6_9BACT|nr:hypothetical protein [Alloacidobacterium dinghuense]QNI30996.1 hypothetical protein H7849_18030 [Alloacidobacterium dinghuense]